MINAIEAKALRSWEPSWLHAIDGKALSISRHSRDRDAGYGWGAGAMEKGYKLHVLFGKNGSIPAWSVEPMNVDERVVARQLAERAEVQGYVVGDSKFDDGGLYETFAEREAQLVAPRKCAAGSGLGHRRQSPSRIRSIELLECSVSGFGPCLLEARAMIERFFGTLVSAHYGLDRLPPWIRGLRRVRAWVQAKLIIDRLADQKRKEAA
jgi:hypothetical protein